MIEFWTDLGVNAQDPKVSQIIDKWDVTQMPVGGSNTKHRASLNAGFGLAISAGSKNPDAAWELVKFGCSPAMNLSQMVTPGTGIDPVYKSTLETESAGGGAAGLERRTRLAERRPSGQDAAGLGGSAGACSRQIEDAGKGDERHASDVGRVACRITWPRTSFAIRRGL
jgi:hypothetical protein